MKIHKLEIYTSRLQDQLAFYKDTLGLEILNSDDKSFEVQLGYTELQIAYREDATPYHIAIHIPAGQEKKALNWLKERTEIQKDNGDEIVDFSNWNAKSVYFYDADKNIMEFIARKNVFPPETGEFSSKSLLGISEVGLATNNIEEKYDFLKTYYGLEVYSGKMDDFYAIGDDHGLLITIDKNKKDWFPSGDKAHSSDFQIRFTHKDRDYVMVFKENRIINF